MLAPFPFDALVILLAAPPGGRQDDAAVADRIRHGDHAAFKAFFDDHHGGLTHYLLRMGLPAEVAKDLIQQAFVMIWERRKEIDSEKSLRAYLYRIAHTRALNHFRDNRRFVEEETLQRFEAAGADSDPDRDALMAALQEAIERLPGRQRAVFQLCFLQQFTYRETARILDISPKTVENHMGHALKALRHALKHFVQD